MTFQVIAASQKLSFVTLEGKDLVSHVHPYTTEFWNSAIHREHTQKIFLELKNNPIPLYNTYTHILVPTSMKVQMRSLTVVAQI